MTFSLTLPKPICVFLSYVFFEFSLIVMLVWTGYLTSRPALKGYVRTRSNLLNSVEKLLTLSLGLTALDTKEQLEKIFVLSEAMGVAQHHGKIIFQIQFINICIYKTL